MLDHTTTSDLADAVGVMPETIARHCRNGTFPGAFRRHGRWRIPVDEAEAFAEAYDTANAEDDAPDEWEGDDG